MTPEPQRRPKRRLNRDLVIVAAIVAVIVAGWLASRLSDNDEPTSEERLCSLLEGGWTGDQLASNDQWKDWPDSQSPVSRSIELADAADRGGCFNLV